MTFWDVIIVQSFGISQSAENASEGKDVVKFLLNQISK